MSSTGYPASARMPRSFGSTWSMRAPGTSNTRISTARTCPKYATGRGQADASSALMRVLVVNAGSSSLKLRVLGDLDEIEATHDVDPWDGEDEADDLAGVLDAMPEFDAVGHRVVH